MQVTVEKLSPVLVELKIEVPAIEVRTEVEKEYARVQRTAKVRGFRPGKAPRHVLSHLYGGAIHADVARKLADRTLNQAISDQQVQPLTQPAVVLGDLKPEDAFSYKARFEIRPEIAAVKWEGLEVKRPKVDVTEAMIDEEVAKLRREHSALTPPDPERPAQIGDVLTVSFRLTLAGAPRPQDAQEIDVELGQSQILKELEQGLLGMKPEETKTIELDFPAQHANAELRGKKGTFDVTVKDLKERVLPEVDDELAKDCGDYASLAALRDGLRAKIEKDLKQRASDAVAEELVLELCRTNPIPVPPSLIDQQAQITENEIRTQARRQGSRGELTPEIRERARLDADMKVRAGLLMAEIAKEKRVQVTEEDIEKGYGELAEQTGKNVAKVKAEYRDPKKREMLIGMILEDKILTLVEDAAKITDAA